MLKFYFPLENGKVKRLIKGEINMGTNTKDFIVKDTGDRTQFDTGSHKDMGEGRGRYDLIPLHTLATLYLETDEKAVAYFLGNIYHSMVATSVDEKQSRLRQAYHIFVNDIAYTSMAESTKALAKLYEAGANKYSARDWEKGRPMEIFINSVLRHFFQYLNGEDDEDHATAVLWNLLSLINTLERLPSKAYTLIEFVDSEPTTK